MYMDDDVLLADKLNPHTHPKNNDNKKDYCVFNEKALGV